MVYRMFQAFDGKVLSHDDFYHFILDPWILEGERPYGGMDCAITNAALIKRSNGNFEFVSSCVLPYLDEHLNETGDEGLVVVYGVYVTSDVAEYYRDNLGGNPFCCSIKIRVFD